MIGWTIAGREALLRAMNVKFALFTAEGVPGGWVDGRWVTEHRVFTRVSEWDSPYTDSVLFTVPETAGAHAIVVIGMFRADDDVPLRWIDTLGSVEPGYTISVPLADLVSIG